MNLADTVPTAWLAGFCAAGYRPLPGPAADPVELSRAFDALDDRGRRIEPTPAWWKRSGPWHLFA